MQGVANMIDSTCNYISTASNLPLEILSSHLPHETSSHFQPSGLPGARQLLFSRRFLATHTIPPPPKHRSLEPLAPKPLSVRTYSLGSFHARTRLHGQLSRDWRY